MKTPCEWDIEFWMPEPINKWSKSCGFQYMRKSYAEGAWAMLKSHYNHSRKHRLLKSGVVIDEIGLQTVKVGLGAQPKKKSDVVVLAEDVLPFVESVSRALEADGSGISRIDSLSKKSKSMEKFLRGICEENDSKP